jgi:hypothetical protein
MRYPTRSAINKINKMYSLKEDSGTQDWGIECSDSGRVEEFIDGYYGFMMTDDERFTLMALILGSFEECDGETEENIKIWMKIHTILANNLDLHRDQVKYYQCNDVTSSECIFPITPLMRMINV